MWEEFQTTRKFCQERKETEDWVWKRICPVAAKLRGNVGQVSGEPKAMLAQQRSPALGRNSLTPEHLAQSLLGSSPVTAQPWHKCCG